MKELTNKTFGNPNENDLPPLYHGCSRGSVRQSGTYVSL